MLRTFALVFSLSLIGALASGQQTNQVSNERATFDGINSGDLTSITMAGKSNNPAFVPYLKDKLHNLNTRGYRDFSHEASLASALRLALVNLDDADAQQEFWCLMTQDTVSSPIEQFQLIGGWYSIQALDAVLLGAGEAGFERALTKTHKTDVVYVPPSQTALMILPKILPQGPDLESFSRMNDNARFKASADAWHNWIATHKQQLSSLKPTGAGVDFSDAACRDGRVSNRR